jgi:hypothetical protein
MASRKTHTTPIAPATAATMRRSAPMSLLTDYLRLFREDFKFQQVAADAGFARVRSATLLR